MALDLSDQSVLIVDDEKFSRSIVAHLLVEMGRPRITHAGNGSEALDALGDETAKFDFVIADFNMPVMHGLEFLKAIRAGEVIPPVDIMIGAIALENNEIVLTRNVKHFRRIPDLKVKTY